MAEYGAWSCSCQFLLGEWVAAKCVFSSDFALRCLPAKMALLRVDSPPTEFPIKQDVERCLEEYAKFCSRRDLLAIVTQSLKTSHGSFTGLSMDDIKQLQDVYNRDKDVRATLLGTFRRTAEQMQQGAAITLFNDKSSPEEDVYLLWAKKVGDKFDVVLATASCTSHLDWSGICAAFVGTVATGAAVVMCPHLAGIGVPLVGGGLAALTCKAASRPDFHNVVRGFMLSELATIGLLQLPCQPEQTPLAPLTLQRRGPTL